MRCRLSLLLFAFLALCYRAPGSGIHADNGLREQAATLAFVDVNVVPMDRATVLENHTVLIAGDRILNVGPSASVEVPENATVIEGNGRYLAPGLADMHVHLQDDSTLMLFVANGVTTVRNLFGFPMHLELKERIEKGEVVGPTLHTAGPILDGDPPVWPGSDVVRSVEDARRLVRQQVETGYEFLKVYERLGEEEYLAIVEEAAKHGIEVHGHVPTAVGLDLALESKQRSIEHLTTYGPSIASADAPRWQLASELRNMVHGWTSLDPMKVDEYVGFTLESETWNCPTLVVLARAFAPEADHATFLEGNESLRYVSSFLRAYWESSPTFEAANLEVQQGMPARYSFIKALQDAGAGLLLGTDTPNPWVVPGFAIHEELAHFVAAGLTPYQAIAAGTVRAAEFLRLEDEFGAVRKGLRADLVLLGSNPLEDVGAYTSPDGVLIRGRWFDREELDRELDTLAGD